MLFTRKEKTVRKHNVNFIMGQVRAVLNEKRVQGICVNCAPDDHGQLYTTEEASVMINAIVDDSLFYAN
jgi:hypothetical protein